MRTEYEAEGIDPDAFAHDPTSQFASWFAEAVETEEAEPYAMVVSTVDAAGRPRGRNVLLRGADADGFVFFTNYGSDKATAMEHTGVAALTFHWHRLHRQVHVEGTVERVSAAESDAYFAKRPRESQLGAWASVQSSELANRAALIDRLMAVTAEFDGGPVPRPDFWGGFRVRPDRVEFWQGQPSRLHDRLRYDRTDDGWRRVLLSP